MVKAIIFDGGGTIWYSMDVLYEHYKIAALFFGFIPSVKDFPYDLKLMNELSSLQSFNSRKNMAKILTALLMKEFPSKDLDKILDMREAESELLKLISELIPKQKFWEIATDMGSFLEEALYNYPETWYPLCKGIKKILPVLKKEGYKIALLSNRRKNSVLNILEAYEIYNCFDYVHAPEESEPLRKDFNPILKNLKVNLEECIFVGDSVLDIKSAKDMGDVKTIATLSGMGTERMFNNLPPRYKPDCIINDAEELISCMKKFEKGGR